MLHNRGRLQAYMAQVEPIRVIRLSSSYGCPVLEVDDRLNGFHGFDRGGNGPFHGPLGNVDQGRVQDPVSGPR